MDLTNYITSDSVLILGKGSVFALIWVKETNTFDLNRISIGKGVVLKIWDGNFKCCFLLKLRVFFNNHKQFKSIDSHLHSGILTLVSCLDPNSNKCKLADVGDKPTYTYLHRSKPGFSFTFVLHTNIYGAGFYKCSIRSTICHLPCFLF